MIRKQVFVLPLTLSAVPQAIPSAARAQERPGRGIRSKESRGGPFRRVALSERPSSSLEDFSGGTAGFLITIAVIVAVVVNGAIIIPW